MSRMLDWLVADVPVARWLVIVLAVTMVFEIIVLIHDVFRKGSS